MTAHDIIWGVIAGVFVFGGGLEWVLRRCVDRSSDE